MTKQKEKKSKLTQGFIPPHTSCPFKRQCVVHNGKGCMHKGKSHLVKFSCAIARAFDLMETT